MLFANLSSFGVEKAGFSTTLIDFFNAYKSTQHSVSLDCPEFSNECTTKNCYMDKNDAKTLITINRDVEKFLDYPY